MKPNEVVGTFFFLSMLGSFSWFSTGHPFIGLATIGLCGIGTISFLSWWGLTDFNEWVKKNRHEQLPHYAKHVVEDNLNHFLDEGRISKIRPEKEKKNALAKLKELK